MTRGLSVSMPRASQVGIVSALPLLALWSACSPPVSTDAGVVADDAGPRGTATELVVVDTERIQVPSWDPVDFRLVAVGLGTAESAYQEGLIEIQEALDPNHTWSTDEGFFVPGAAHRGPYDGELDEALAAKSRTTFTVDEFTPPAGIMAMFTLVPASPPARGVSPDAPDGGTIIANDVFPIVMGGTLTSGDVEFDANFFNQIENPTLWTEPFTVDGASHVVLAFPMSHEMAPEGTPIPGTYKIVITLNDVTEAGYVVTLRFTIGKPCNCDDDCEGGTCNLSPAGVRVCGASCSSDDSFCPSGQACVMTSNKGPDGTAGVCQTSSDVLHPDATVCTTSTECISGLCLAASAAGRSVCKTSCDVDEDCPPLYICAEGACLLGEVGTPCPAPPPPPPSTCASTPPATLAPLLAALALVRRRRRS